MNAFSRRASSHLEPNRLARALETRRSVGGEILDLTVTNPTDCGLAWPVGVIERILAGVDSSRYRPEPFGMLDARVAIAEQLARCGIRTSPDRVILTASTSEAYGYLLKLLCDPTDRLLVPAPGYPLLDSLARLESVELERFRYAYDGRWHLDKRSLSEAAARERVRAVVLVHPNNPTGAFVSRADFAAASSLGLPVVSDEVFGAYRWIDDPDRPATLFENDGVTLLFRLDGLSKFAVLPQLKIAWAVLGGPAALVRDALARLEHIADTYLSPSVPVQLALPALLAEAPAMRERVRARCRTNLTAIADACAGTALTLLPPEGGWTAVLRLPAIHDDETWSLFLLEQAGVLTHPGYFYDFTDGAFLVLSLLTDPATLATGIERVGTFVDKETRS